MDEGSQRFQTTGVIGGERRALDLRMATVLEDGETTGIIAVIRDTTELDPGAV